MGAHLLIPELRDARRLTLELFADLDDEQRIGPELETVNPPLWEVGHVAWFQERFILRERLGRAPLMEGVDGVYDSIAVHHPERWRRLLPPPEAMLDYCARVLAAVEEELEGAREEDEHLRWLAGLVLHHEDMHVEALLYTRQALGYPPPASLRSTPPHSPDDWAEPRGDVELPGGVFRLGADSSEPFVFDNEKWGHEVELEPFAIARHAVTQGEFLEFVDDAGYDEESYWSAAGWRWRREHGATEPAYWRIDEKGDWYRRRFDAWVPLEPGLPVCHVNRFEAEAYCNWAGRRLPSEAEWEAAAALDGAGAKRRFPWGDAADPARANLDVHRGGPLPVDALGEGDSRGGCRQMLGNVWEWTASTFLPYPGFEPDPYREYSEPWFGSRKVLRGGSWASRSRMLRNTWRNFFTPDRRDVFAGFRTCRLDR